MIPTLTRELIAIARRPSLWAVPAVQGLLLALFVSAWGTAGRVPFLPGENLYEQLCTIHWVFVTVAVPWCVCRATATDERDAWPLLSLLSGLTPGRLLMARAMASTIYFLIVVGSAMPIAMLAADMSAVTGARVATDATLLLLFAAVAALLTLHLAAWARDPFRAWLLATPVVIAVRWALALVFPALAPLVLASVVILALVVLVRRADRTLMHLAERAS